MARTTALPHIRRRLALALATALLLVGAPLEAPTKAQATDDIRTACHFHGKYCYSTAVRLVPVAGAQFDTHLNLMRPDSTDPENNHVNVEMWNTFANGNYMEAGIQNGYVGKNGYTPPFEGTDLYQSGNNFCPNTGCGAYTLFWADTVYHNPQHTRATQYLHYVRTLAPTGQTLVVKFLPTYKGSTAWNITFTIIETGWTYTATSTAPGGATIVKSEMGLENGTTGDGNSKTGGACADQFVVSGYYYYQGQGRQLGPLNWDHPDYFETNQGVRGALLDTFRYEVWKPGVTSGASLNGLGC